MLNAYKSELILRNNNVIPKFKIKHEHKDYSAQSENLYKYHTNINDLKPIVLK